MPRVITEGAFKGQPIRRARKAGKCEYWLGERGKCGEPINIGDEYIEGELSVWKAGGFGCERWCMKHAPPANATFLQMRRVDDFLSRRAKAMDASALVYQEPDGTFTLERDGIPSISLGGPHPMARRVIDTMRKTTGVSNVSRDPEPPRFPVEPALAPTEWQFIDRDTAGDDIERLVQGEGRYDAAIAIANIRLSEDDPRKITVAKIKAMRDCAEQLSLEGYDDYGLQRFADALESYLPPKR